MQPLYLLGWQTGMLTRIIAACLHANLDRGTSCHDCRYSQDGLKDITSFKNRDRAVGTILHGLVTAGDLHAYLATLTKTDEADENMEYVDSNITVNHVTTLDGSAVGLPFASSRAYSARHLHMTDILQVRRDERSACITVSQSFSNHNRHLPPGIC